MRGLFFILLLVSLFSIGAKANLSTSEATEIAEKTFNALDMIENGANTAWSWTKSHRSLIKSILGTIMLFYGGQFGNTLVFVQALSVNGWPAVQKGLRELAGTYSKVRGVLKEEMPDLIKAKKDYDQLSEQLKKEQEKITAAKADLKNGKISATKFDELEKSCDDKMSEIRISQRKIHAISNVLSQVKSAVNPVHLSEVLTGSYQAIILGIAAVSSQTIATLTQGLSMGKIAYERILKFFGKFKAKYADATVVHLADDFVSTHEEWVQIAGKAISRSLGVLAAYLLDKATTVFSVCSMASDIIVNAAEDLLDPILEAFQLPTIKGTPQGSAVVHTALMAIGVKSQLMPGGTGNGIPILLKLVLAPVIAFEFFLSNLVLKKAQF